MTDLLPEEQKSNEAGPSGNRSGSIAWALVLIGLGVWFLLGNLGFQLPNMSQMWPIFVLVPGLAALVGYAVGEDHEPGLAFLGTAATLLGVFFFMTTLGIGGLTTSDMGRLWPVYPLIGGVAFVVQWIASGFKDWGALIPAGIALIVGVVGLGAVVIGETGRFINLLVRGWPLILILIGLGLLVGYFVNPRSD